MCIRDRLGAGRIKKEDSIDFAAGIIMHKKLGDAVKAGEPICTLYADDDKMCIRDRHKLHGALRQLCTNFAVGPGFQSYLGGRAAPIL